MLPSLLVLLVNALGVGCFILFLLVVYLLS